MNLPLFVLKLFSCPTFLSTFMNLCYAYRIKWRYEFNHVKSGIVTSGESKGVYSEAIKEHTWVLGGESVIELCKYKNVGVVENYIGSFSINDDDNIDKTRKKTVCYFPRILTSGRSIF